MKKILSMLAVAAAAATVAPSASAHATVSVFGGASALAGARTTYVLRVPNERANRSTTRIVLQVPEVFQTGITVHANPGWNTRLTTRPTGQVDAEGNPVVAVTQIVWTLKQGFDVGPRFYAELYFRVQNPTTPQRVCFPVQQVYSAQYNARGVPRRGGRGEIVNWAGDSNSATPASCLNIVA